MTEHKRRYAPIMFITFFFNYSYMQSHDFMFSSTKVMRRNAIKSWKLEAILDFGGHFDFSYPYA